MGKFFGLAHGRFRLLMPLLFNRYFAGHGSLPDVLKAGVFSEIRIQNYQTTVRVPAQNSKLGKKFSQTIGCPRDTTGPETSALLFGPRFNARMADNRTISQLEAEGYPWIGCECCKGTVWVPFRMLRERIPMLSAMTLVQLGAKMRCDKCGKRPERYYPANRSDTPGFVRSF